MKSDSLLSTAASRDRYEEERRQGETIAGGEESAWGWMGPAGSLRAERRAAFLIQQAELKSGVRCLELGCGTGEFTSRLLRSGCDLCAVEISEATAKICQQRVGAQARVIVGNIETGEGLGAQPYDAIVGVSVLHHVNMELCLKTTFGLLKPGGRFAFSEPNMANPQVWAERHIGIIKRWRHVTAHETAFYSRQLRELFERAGLAVDVCEPFEFLHPWTPRLLLKPVMGMEWLMERTPLRRIAGSLRIAGHKPA